MKKVLAIMLGVVLCLGVVMMTGCGVFDGNYKEIDWNKAKEVTQGLEFNCDAASDKNGWEYKIDGYRTAEHTVDKKVGEVTYDNYFDAKAEVELNAKTVKVGEKANSEMKAYKLSEYIDKLTIKDGKTEYCYEYEKGKQNVKRYFDGEFNYINSDEYIDYLERDNTGFDDYDDETLEKYKQKSGIDGVLKFINNEILGEWLPSECLDAETIVGALEGKSGVKFSLDEQKANENKLKIEFTDAQVLIDLGVISKEVFGDDLKLNKGQVIFVFNATDKVVTNWKYELNAKGKNGKIEVTASIEAYTGKVNIPEDVKKYEEKIPG